MKKVDIRVVMKRAWEIAREGQKKFGGKVKEYFAMALKLAWKEVKKVAVKLVGSEKQIKWAEDIRKQVIEKMERVIAEVEEVYKEKPKKLEFLGEYKAAFEVLKNEEKAAFWIEFFKDCEKHVFVVYNFNRHLSRKGLEDLWKRLSKVDTVATKLDLDTM